MTDKEIRKLNRLELLEVMVSVSEENEALRNKVEALQQQLDERELEIESAGSIAEASLELSGVFEAAQDAADRYLVNIKKMSDNAKQNAQKEAAQILSKAKKECSKLEIEAKKQVEEKWQSLKKMLDDYMKENGISKKEVRQLVAEQRQAKGQKSEIN